MTKSYHLRFQSNFDLFLINVDCFNPLLNKRSIDVNKKLIKSQFYHDKSRLVNLDLLDCGCLVVESFILYNTVQKILP